MPLPSHTPVTTYVVPTYNAYLSLAYLKGAVVNGVRCCKYKSRGE